MREPREVPFELLATDPPCGLCCKPLQERRWRLVEEDAQVRGTLRRHLSGEEGLNELVFRQDALEADVRGDARHANVVGAMRALALLDREIEAKLLEQRDDLANSQFSHEAVLEQVERFAREA